MGRIGSDKGSLTETGLPGLSREERKMKMIRVIAAMLLGCLLCTAGLADGYSEFESGDGMGIFRGTAVVCSRNVTIRTEPSYSGKKVQSASNGETLSVLGEYGNWVQVAYEKKGQVYEGWVIRSYIVIEPMTLTLLSSNIPAYCAPDGNAKLVGSLAKGTQLTVLGTWDGYYIVNLREASAFVPMDADLVTSSQLYAMAASSGITGRVRTRTVMRTGPGTDFGACGTAEAGMWVRVGEFDEGWVLVLCNGAAGYVPESALEIYGADSDING